MTSKSPAKKSVKIKTPAHLHERVALLQKRLKKEKIDALLLTNPKDIRYLTGFCGDDSWALVPTKSSAVHLISDFRFIEDIQRSAPHAKMHIRKGAISEALAKLNEKLDLDHLAVQADYLTLAQFKSLKKKLGKKHLEPIDDGLIKQRAVKNELEIKAILAALKIQQNAFLDLKKEIKAGQSEQEIAAKLEYLMRVGGADGTSFPSIVAADANASLPHAVPGKAKVKTGGSLLIDWGAKYDGYCSDLTRMLALGSLPAKIKEIYQIVLEAQLAAIAAIKPGVKLKAVDDAARQVITKAGYGEQFGHGTGHGIGLDIHEQPTLSFRAEGELEPGQIVTVEPGIYLPGIGGVRIEDDILVTNKGHTVLSDLPKDVQSVII